MRGMHTQAGWPWGCTKRVFVLWGPEICDSSGAKLRLQGQQGRSQFLFMESMLLAEKDWGGCSVCTGGPAFSKGCSHLHAFLGDLLVTSRLAMKMSIQIPSTGNIDGQGSPLLALQPRLHLGRGWPTTRVGHREAKIGPAPRNLGPLWLWLQDPPPCLLCLLPSLLPVSSLPPFLSPSGPLVNPPKI